MSSNQQNPENGHPGKAAPGWPEAGDAPQAASPEFITAQLVPDSQAAIRPVWTAIAVCVAAIIISAITSGIVLVVAALVARGPQVLQDVPRLLSWVEQFGGTPQGLLVLLLPAQLVFLSMACGAALLSPRPFVSRLSLGRGVLPLWTWLVFTIGTPIVGIFSSMTLSMFVTELSENLKLIESMMRANAQTSLPMLLVLVAVTPGFIEELMFRGY
ncbi:MAG: hypothetical protein JJ992_18565, partial [Planctomycetes bacterium]|nr:hypothetical protein [Planctomycetota bacterium]